MNAISTLLESGSDVAAEDLIMALSHHFRYVFKNSRTLQLLKNEMEEVSDYCRIYTIKGGIPIYVQSNVSEEAMDWQVPGLIIQTFAENSIKYSGRGGKMLTIRIQAAVEMLDETRRLVVNISDNGKGYSDENLNALNAPIQSEEFPSEHIGIYNLKSRLMLLYGSRAECHFFNAPYGGAAVQITVPETTNEYTGN